MEFFFGFICILLAIALIFVVVIQNSKGGGLSSTLGGSAQQMLGARRSTEYIEKITWYLAGGLALVAFLANIMGGVQVGDANQIRSSDQIDQMILPQAAPVQDPATLPSAGDAAPAGDAATDQ